MGIQKQYFNKTDVIYIAELIKGELVKYVKAVNGKELSDNNFTDELLTKLENIDVSAYAPINSPDLLGTPTALDPESGERSRIATVSYIIRAISDISGIEFKKVGSKAELPTVGEKGVIYLVPKDSATNDIYTEYYWVSATETTPGFYEILGDTSIDLSGYVKEEDLVPIPQSEIIAAWNSVFNK